MKIFITGADGVIGSHLTEELVRAGYKVRAFVMYNSFNSWGWLDHCAADVKKQFEVFAGDIRDTTLGIATAKLRDYLQTHTQRINGFCVNIATGQVIRAMVPIHTFGHPVDIEGLLAVAYDFNIVLVEDAAESLGSTYNGKHTRTFGVMGTLSFNGNKTITTGGGGAILTNNAFIAKRAKHITTTAKIPHTWEFAHDEIGYNYRLPNLNAALGCAQLEQLPEKLIAKRKLFEQYNIAFSALVGAKLVVESPKSCSNYWLQTLMLNTDQAYQRYHILEAKNQAGIMTRPVWRLINELQPFADCPRMVLSTSESLAQRLINIPSSPSLI